MKKAFTLIELLVVIAIIAILAAILFPVFAQAKAAAKASANLSNLKQVGLGHLQYSADSDDVFALAARYHDSFTDAGNTTNNDALVTWHEAVFPYTKNRDIYTSPLEASAPGATPAIKQRAQWQYYGVVPRVTAISTAANPVVLAAPTNVSAIVDGPFGVANGNAAVGSLSQTAVDHLSDVVMVADAGSYDMGYLGGGNGTTQPTINVAAPVSTARTTGSFTAVQPFGTGTVMTGPWARKNTSGSWNGGKAVPTFVQGNAKGQTQYCAVDGSAKSVDISKMYEVRATGNTNAPSMFYRLNINAPTN